MLYKPIVASCKDLGSFLKWSLAFPDLLSVRIEAVKAVSGEYVRKKLF